MFFFSKIFIFVASNSYFMRRFLLLSITILLSITAFAQLEVKPGSFKEVPGFVNINPDQNYQADDNDLPFAVIKVRTENITDKQRRELIFESNLAVGILLEYKTGEVWVYLTAKYADYLKISHPDFSSIEFTIPFDLQPKKGYEMTLVNKFNYTSAPDVPDFNYLIIKSDQPNSLVYIDDVYIGEGEGSKSFPLGEKHTWRIDCDMYHSESGEVMIVEGEPMVIEKQLRPAFGFISVTSQPENGAMVFIDGKKAGVTPYKSDKMKSGTYKVRIIKEMYNPSEQEVIVTDGKTTETNLVMTANFVNVSVRSDSESDIYVDNEKKGKGVWTGRLTQGNHVFEAKKESHKTSVQTAELKLGKDESIVLPNPEPIYGTIDINSTPMGAAIIIDGKVYGTTPRILKDVLIGKHELRLEKSGYTSVKKMFVLNEKVMLTINETMEPVKGMTQKPVKPVKEQKVTAAKPDGGFSNYKFMMLNVSYSNYSDLSYGLTFGSVGKTGWFASVITNLSFKFSADYECGNDFLVNGNYIDYDGTEYYTAFSLMGGFIYRLSEPLALKVGAGYGIRNLMYETTSKKLVKNTDVSASGIDLSAGALYRIGRLAVSLDVVTASFKIFEASLGIGYTF